MERPFDERFEKFPWRESNDDLEKWQSGLTGYPIVDAGMRELNQTGFMHNRARMIVGSFLTKHLLLNWRLGERYFAKLLFDFELASNVGNCSGSPAAVSMRHLIFEFSIQLYKRSVSTKI